MLGAKMTNATIDYKWKAKTRSEMEKEEVEQFIKVFRKHFNPDDTTADELLFFLVGDLIMKYNIREK